METVPVGQLGGSAPTRAKGGDPGAAQPVTGNRPLLTPGSNCWRLEPASRAACLIDGETYYPAVKQALLEAQHSVLLLGWDFSDDARLWSEHIGPDWPDEIGALLRALCDRRPDLHVAILVWDKSVLLSLGRRRFPGSQAARMAHDRIRFVFDAAHPPLATHHQKVVVIDDALAFCGGFDFAANRWDTRRHRLAEPRRRLPTGAPYEPHHDVMLAVDGNAARALGDLARDRWHQATGERLSPAPAGKRMWPDRVAPHFRDVEVGIARTRPAWRGREAVYEVETLYLDAIAAAERSIYMENQYFASRRIADALAARLAEPGGPEIVLVNPKRSPSTIEQIAMDNARTQIVHRLRKADRFGRFRLYAAVNGEREIVVHSKLMIVDDRLLRVGSANLANRSLGTDTECDLAIEAAPASPEAEAIARLREDLLSEHLGVDRTRIAAAVRKSGSLIRAIEALDGTSERQLRPFPKPRVSRIHRFEHNAFADPLRPIRLLPSRPAPRTLACLLLAGLAALPLAAAARKRRRHRDSKKGPRSRLEPGYHRVPSTT